MMIIDFCFYLINVKSKIDMQDKIGFSTKMVNRSIGAEDTEIDKVKILLEPIIKPRYTNWEQSVYTMINTMFYKAHKNNLLLKIDRMFCWLMTKLKPPIRYFITVTKT